MNAPYLKEIPSFMTELPNLQTLDLRKSPVVSLTNDFWKMQQLRHLFLSRCGEVLQGRGTVMSNLQTLSFVHVSVASFSPSRGTTLFPNVKKLAVYGGNLYGCNKLERLRTLKIVGNIYKAIQPKILPSCLTKLTLRNTRLRQDSVDTLGRLPNLLILKLFDDSLSTYDGILVFGKRSFLQLQVLHFVELGFSLSGWCVESGALQSLQNLLFRGCRHLSSIPDELKHVTTLRHVKTMWCSDTLAEDISRKLGKDVDFSISAWVGKQEYFEIVCVDPPLGRGRDSAGAGDGDGHSEASVRAMTTGAVRPARGRRRGSSAVKPVRGPRRRESSMWAMAGVTE
ncbi:hypothetical protein RJ640_012312 [Escallonia rubra]|uniref:Disease resistance R13L4/SHOC-2-like LRR domain-containing protein n=1 Tax=Escallonia rubra TaxID=112253 RepID=A0AA88U518_9ASTE|nr:hypothetical protein RJ640_012312 [Escallonia rubra]